MVGSFITRALILVLGYAYPAYDCYKTVELSKPEIEQLRFWCQYWILLAVLTVFERVGDNFISWLPMYSEAKLAFIVYLWYPKTQGTAYVYESFFKPYIAKHETEIDRNLLELRTRAGDMAVFYFQKVANYGQTRFYEILQYIASQSQTQRSDPQGKSFEVRQAAGLLLKNNMRATFSSMPPFSQLGQLSVYFFKLFELLDGLSCFRLYINVWTVMIWIIWKVLWMLYTRYVRMFPKSLMSMFLVCPNDPSMYSCQDCCSFSSLHMQVVEN